MFFNSNNFLQYKLQGLSPHRAKEQKYRLQNDSQRKDLPDSRGVVS
jgi:hypothetical protein